MSTAAQIAANRANSKHSTGAKTEEGKAASSHNHFSFGFTARFVVLERENQAGFDALLASLQAEHNPATATEFILVTKMAEHFWLARRAQAMQDTTWDPENTCDGDDKMKALALFLRYQTTHDRAFYKALNQLQKLRAEKLKAEIGFESQKRQQAAEARRLEAETREKEAHEARVRLQNSKAEWNELNTEIKGSIEAILPGHTAISFADLKPFLKSAKGAAARPQTGEELARPSGGAPDTVPVLREFLQSAIKDFVAYKTSAA